jgi:hypothetical protein
MSSNISVWFTGKKYKIIIGHLTIEISKEEMGEITSRISSIQEYCNLCGYPPIGYDENFKRLGGYGDRKTALFAGAEIDELPKL